MENQRADIDIPLVTVAEALPLPEIDESKLFPIRQFVIEVQGSCNFGCSCYMYTGDNADLRNRYKPMHPKVAAQAAYRIAEHIVEHDLPEVDIVLHGGEPLLRPQHLFELVDVFRNSARRYEQELTAKKLGIDAETMDDAQLTAALAELGMESTLDKRLRFHVQTNGYNLSRDTLQQLREYNVMVGVSLDGGTAEDHDRSRPLKGGGSSFAGVEATLNMLRDEFPDIFERILCTINLQNDPVALYDKARSFRPSPEKLLESDGSPRKFKINFLLPHATWNNPPEVVRPGTSTRAYDEFLLAVFNRWLLGGSFDPQTIEIPFFGDIIRGYLGKPSENESMGLSPVRLISIEQDGSYREVDSRKIDGKKGEDDTGYNVFRNSVEQVRHHPYIVLRQIGKDALSKTCLQCPIVNTCGGGLFTHRFSDVPRTTEVGPIVPGPRNPSVYCRTLFRVIQSVQDVLPKR